MDINLNSFSSNLMLIALVLVGLCCLYLLYSNFTKVREIEELKRRVEDLKKIFLNQQMHNDETFSKINTVLFQTLSNGEHMPDDKPISKIIAKISTLDVNNEIAKEVSDELKLNLSSPTKTINIDEEESNNIENSIVNNLVINKEGYINENINNELEKVNIENKEVNIDLHDLDNLDDADDTNPTLDADIDELNLDYNSEEIDADKIVFTKTNQSIFDEESNTEITKDNLFNLDTVNIANAEIFDDLEDALSIATAPIDETNDVINHNTNFNLDDIQDIDDIDDIDNIDNLEPVDVKTIQIDITKSEDIDLGDLLNGKTHNHNNQSKNSETKLEQQQNIKTIDVDSHKTDYNNMSVKQLKDLAKSYGLKITGTKQELIQILLANNSK
jgi:hypothetical protein